jgi:hypothetical protein
MLAYSDRQVAFLWGHKSTLGSELLTMHAQAAYQGADSSRPLLKNPLKS